MEKTRCSVYLFPAALYSKNTEAEEMLDIQHLLGFGSLLQAVKV
jgi:hypothetical protein